MGEERIVRLFFLQLMEEIVTMHAVITTVIPTYRRPALLKRAIRSVLAQTYSDFTILVMDNASCDETQDVVRALMQEDSRIKLIEQPENVGITRNFISGLAAVTTPYVSFLPDDDFIAPTLFEEALEIHKSHPDIAFCGGSGLVFDEEYRFMSIETDGQKIPPSGYYPPPSGYHTYLNTIFGITFPSLVFSTEVVRKLGGIDPRIHFGIDEDLVSKCSATHAVYLLTDHPTYFGCHHSSQLSCGRHFDLFEEDCLHLRENILKLLSEEKLARFFDERLIKIWTSAFEYHKKRREFKKAHAYAQKLWEKTEHSRWKRKEREMRLPSPLISMLDLLKTVERVIRKGREKPTYREKILSPDSKQWKEYALKLEERTTCTPY